MDPFILNKNGENTGIPLQKIPNIEPFFYRGQLYEPYENRKGNPCVLISRKNGMKRFFPIEFCIGCNKLLIIRGGGRCGSCRSKYYNNKKINKEENNEKIVCDGGFSHRKPELQKKIVKKYII